MRRASHRHYYAAIYDHEGAALIIVRRTGVEVVERSRVPAPLVRLPAALTLASAETSPTRLTATLVDADGRRYTASAADTHRSLQGPGDPGVLSTARTLFPSERNEALPALGNVHLLPYGAQEGEVVLESPAGQAVIDSIHERSTAAFREINVTTTEAFGVTAPSVVAATSGIPRERGATVHVATDVPARVSLEVASRVDFLDARRVEVGATRAFEAATEQLSGLDADSRVYWRALVQRHGRAVTGPARAFRVLPPGGSASAVSICVGACASQFGEIFDRLTDRRPDVFVGRATSIIPTPMGRWPRRRAATRESGGTSSRTRVFGRCSTLAASWRGATTTTTAFRTRTRRTSSRLAWPRGKRSWTEATTTGSRPASPRCGSSTSAASRLRPANPTPRPRPSWATGNAGGCWTRSPPRAPFKVICSPCTLSPTRSENARDGNWSAGYTAERDLLLGHIKRKVTGTTIFITGDTHYTMVYDRDGLFEARPCPLDIPTPNDITLVDPLAAQELRGRPGVVYAEDRLGHFAHLRVAGVGQTARLDLTLVRQDGAAGYSRSFEERIPGSPRHLNAGPQRGAGGRGDIGGRGGIGGRGIRRRLVGAHGDGGPGGSSGLPFTGSRPMVVALAGALLAATGAVARGWALAAGNRAIRLCVARRASGRRRVGCSPRSRLSCRPAAPARARRHRSARSPPGGQRARRSRRLRTRPRSGAPGDHDACESPYCMKSSSRKRASLLVSSP